MTAPAGGGRATTVAPGATVLLTEYAPGGDDALTIINDSTVRAYLAADSGVSSSNGVPLDPHTSTTWSTPGQLWATVDPAETAAAELIATGAVGDWQPSPAVIGLEVATALAEEGVPNTLLIDSIFVGVINAGATTAPVDVSKYSSMLVFARGSLAFEIYTANFFDSAGNALYSQKLSCGGGDVPNGLPYVLDVSLASFVQFSNPNAIGAITLNAEGSNRVVNPKVDGRFANPGSPSVASYTGNLPAGADTLLGITSVQGLAFLSVAFTGITTITGWISVVTERTGVQQTTLRIADSSQVDSNNTIKSLIALGAGYKSIVYHNNTSGQNGTIRVEITPAFI